MSGKPGDKAHVGSNNRWRVSRAGLLYFVMFLVPVLVGAYFFRAMALESAMSTQLAYDSGMIPELAFSWPCPVNAKGSGGQTPLHWAVNARRTDVVERLLSKGADVNAKDTNGWTPLHVAALSGDREFVELLIAKGADLAARDDLGRTALGLAVGAGHEAVADVLRKAGAKE